MNFLLRFNQFDNYRMMFFKSLIEKERERERKLCNVAEKNPHWKLLQSNLLNKIQNILTDWVHTLGVCCEYSNKSIANKVSNIKSMWNSTAPVPIPAPALTKISNHVMKFANQKINIRFSCSIKKTCARLLSSFVLLNKNENGKRRKIKHYVFVIVLETQGRHSWPPAILTQFIYEFNISTFWTIA